MKGKNKDIVKHDISQASDDHGSHGQLRPLVISDKTKQNVIEKKCRGKEQKPPKIDVSHFPYGSVRTQSGCHLPGKEETGQHKKGRKQNGQIDGVSIKAVYRFLTSLAL